MRPTWKFSITRTQKGTTQRVINVKIMYTHSVVSYRHSVSLSSLGFPFKVFHPQDSECDTPETDRHAVMT